MKKIIYILVFGLLTFKMSAQETTKYLELNMELQPNEIVYLFGDNVKFRAAPNTDAEVLSFLKIGTELIVVEKVATTYSYNGIDWPWYKVKYNDKEGYIIGGLISLDKKEIDDSVYLISLKKIEGDFHIVTRVFNKKSNKYLEDITRFGTEYSFSLEVFGNKGIENISNMAFIDYHAEACGINGGGYYLFNNDVSLTKAMSLFSVGDGGIYWFDEAVIFPNEKGGKKGRILYKRESGEVVDESNNQTKTTIETCEFVWEGKLLELKTVKE